MAPQNPITAAADSFKLWVGIFMTAATVGGVALVGQYKTEENCLQIRQNTGAIVELKINQREFSTDYKHIKELLVKIDRKLDK